LIIGGKVFREQLALAAKELLPRALLLTRNLPDAEDLMSETIERALRFEHQFTAGSNMRAWLNQIQYSVFVTRFRRRAREQRALQMMEHDPCAFSEREAITVMHELSPPLQKAIRTLPTVFAQTLLLVDAMEYGYKEAAEQLGVPVGTVMSRLHRARRLLRTALAA
jgi:RNA polymerase sigma-70 factor (ECF subfamily)